MPFAEKKHERMRSANPFLGIVSDFAASVGFVLLRIKEKRRQKLISQVRRVLEKGSLTSAEAASLRGKLYFTTLCGILRFSDIRFRRISC